MKESWNKTNIRYTFKKKVEVLQLMAEIKLKLK